MIKQIRRISSSVSNHDYPALHFLVFTDGTHAWTLLQKPYSEMQLINVEINVSERCPDCGYSYDAKEIS